MKKIDENYIDPLDKLTWNTVKKEQTSFKSRLNSIITVKKWLSPELLESQWPALDNIIADLEKRVKDTTCLIFNYDKDGNNN